MIQTKASQKRFNEFHEAVEQARELGIGPKQLKQLISDLKSVEICYHKIVQTCSAITGSSSSVSSEQFCKKILALAVSGEDMHWEKLLCIYCKLAQKKPQKVAV